jgi:RNA-directed DNA polymerase
MSEAKPFCISKWEVWEAYKRVKASQGAAGVEEQSIADFERDLKGNLYKIWNRRVRDVEVKVGGFSFFVPYF